MVTLAMTKNAQSVASDIHIEKRLFHGTSPDAVDAICKQNFDWRVCGKTGTKYGKGSYFATKASYSHLYAKSGSDGFQFMFLAKVLVGSFIKEEPEYRRPPNKDPSNPSSDLFDSCVDNERNPEIFVIFDSDQCYPEYVIKYFTLDQDQILLTPSNFQARTIKSAGIIRSPNPHGVLTGSAPNLQKPDFPRSQGLTAKPWRPSTSLNANRELSHSPSNRSERVLQLFKTNTWTYNSSLSANKALSHSATNSQQPLSAPRSSQDLATNQWRPSTSLSANRTLSQSVTNSQQPLSAPRSSQYLTSYTSRPSTSPSVNSALSHSATSSQQPLTAPRSSQDLTPNPWRPSTSLGANRLLFHSASNLQQPIKTFTSSQGGRANVAGSSDTFTASDSNAQSKKKQRNYSDKSKICLIQ